MRSSLTLLFFYFININARQINDIIPVINLTSGKTDTVLISDLFFSDNYDVIFNSGNNVDVVFNAVENKIIFTPAANFTGYELIGFKHEGSSYQIPVFVKRKIDVQFKYKPEGKPVKVNLFGTFNNWNRNSIPMKDKDQDGIFEAAVPLDPGRYEYKFYVDGVEVADPENPNKTPSGVGDFNSVLFLENLGKNKNYLHILGKENDEEGIHFRFLYENDVKEVLQEKDIIILIDNKKPEANSIEISGNEIEITLSRDQFSENKILRIAVSRSGLVSNMQTVHIGSNSAINGFNWHDAVIYSLMIDRFSDGDSSNSIPVNHPELSEKANYQGGDFQGIINKIESGYFDSLGINTIWLSPVIENTNNPYRETPEPHRYYTGYHGYWPVHPTNVEEHFGTFELLQELIRKAHEREIKILLDYIAHHVHIEHPYWKEHRDWFGKLELPDGRLNLRLWDEYRLTTWFEPYMPSFDFNGSEEALEEMTDNAVWWLKETGADGFRHDAVKHVPNELWRLLTKKLKKEFKRDLIYQIGETFGSYELISSYVNNGQLSAQFNFNLFDVATKTFLDKNSSFTDLDLEMKKTFSIYGISHLMGNIIDSHDKVRFMAFADGDIPIGGADADEIGWNNSPEVNNKSSFQKLELYLAYIMTIPGVPVIYYGDEIGMTGASDPDNRRMMQFENELNTDQKETFRKISRLIHLRKDHPALRYGDFQTLHADKNVYSFVRCSAEERILVILNKGNSEEKIDLKLPPFYRLKKSVELLSGETAVITKNRISISAEPLSYKIFNLE